MPSMLPITLSVSMQSKVIDLLLVAPLNRTVSPLDPAFNNLFQLVFRGCVTQ